MGGAGVLEWAEQRDWSGAEYWADQSFSAHSSAPTPPGVDGVGALEWALAVNEFQVGWAHSEFSVCSKQLQP